MFQGARIQEAATIQETAVREARRFRKLLGSGGGEAAVDIHEEGSGKGGCFLHCDPVKARDGKHSRCGRAQRDIA